MSPRDRFWDGRRVFVTGASGIVGSWLVKELVARRAAVTALVRDADPQSELFRSGDIRDVSVLNGELENFWTLERALNDHEIDTVFHLGAQPIVSVAARFPMQTFEANIRGTYNLLEACRLHSGLVKRVVVASSDKAYGEQAALPYTEEMGLNGKHPYEVSKSCADMLAQSYHHTFGLPVGIARCGNIYGGGDLNWSRIVPGTIRSFLVGEEPVIRSDGSLIRDYIYVKDAVLGYLKLAEQLGHPAVQGQAFNFSPEDPRAVTDVVSEIQRLMGCGHLAPRIENKARGEIRSQHLSSQKARTRLNWQPGYTLESGLRETIDWYRSFYTRLNA